MKLVITADGTWITASAAYLVEMPPHNTAEDVAEFMDTMSDNERGEWASSVGLPINEL